MEIRFWENGVVRNANEQEAAEAIRLSSEYESKIPERKAKSIREERDVKLMESDWVVVKAVDQNAQDGLGIQIPQVWLDYRQALRDIPDQDGFPLNVIWPTKPS